MARPALRVAHDRGADAAEGFLARLRLPAQRV